MDFVESTDNQEKYSWEDILTMFGGFKYFSREHLLCLYHRVNGREDEAKVFQDVIDEEANKVREALKKMFSEAEIEELKQQLDSQKENNDQEI
jgi:hypothetical protein